jgi:AmmeMemoRadiSam system protein B
MERDPAVAGRFYGADGAALAREVAGYLAAAGAAGSRAPALGLVAPHAGYVYSGAIAGAAYGRVALPAKVIVLCPNHTGLGAEVALWPGGGWRTPLGRVPVDAALTAALAASPRVEEDPEAHRREHALEVQLPFLQVARPDVAIAALCLGHLRLGDCEALGRDVAAAATAAGALVVASSDMSHYVPAAVARAQDGRALERLLALDAAGLYEVVHRERISMCGIVPATVMLVAARLRGATRAELVRYGHSGEVTGDDDAVVGYAAAIVS